MMAHFMQKLRCSRCGKRLWKKHARMIDGKVLCSPCVFARRDSGSGPEGENSRSEVEGEAPQSGARSAIAQTSEEP